MSTASVPRPGTPALAVGVLFDSGLFVRGVNPQQSTSRPGTPDPTKGFLSNNGRLLVYYSDRVLPLTIRRLENLMAQLEEHARSPIFPSERSLLLAQRIHAIFELLDELVEKVDTTSRETLKTSTQGPCHRFAALVQSMKALT